MRLEAEAVVKDVLFAVAEMYVSQNLDSALDVAYINVEIREGNRYCLELTEAGLRVRHADKAFFCCTSAPVCLIIVLFITLIDFSTLTGGGLCLRPSG